MGALVLDRAAGLALKGQGQQLALAFAGEWSETIVAEFKAWADKQRAMGFKTCTIEMFRAQCVSQPDSHKAWGALPRVLVRQGLLQPHLDAEGNPIYRPAAAPKTHGHPIRTWLLGPGVS